MSKTLLDDAEAVNHIDASDYLLSRRWTRSDSRRGFAAIYRSPGNREEVHVPLERDLGDYKEAMLEVARGIARYERREITAVLHDLTRARVAQDRETALRAIGFEDVSEERRREQLVQNISMFVDWPKDHIG